MVFAVCQRQGKCARIGNNSGPLSAAGRTPTMSDRYLEVSQTPWGNALVSLQFALAFTLLLGAGLLIQSVRQVLSASLGYDPGNLVAFSIAPGKKFKSVRLFGSNPATGETIIYIENNFHRHEFVEIISGTPAKLWVVG